MTLCTQKYDMGDKTLYNLVTEAFPIVLFVKKLEDNSRRVMEITECEILEDGTRQLHTLYRYHVCMTSFKRYPRSRPACKSGFWKTVCRPVCWSVSLVAV